MFKNVAKTTLFCLNVIKFNKSNTLNKQTDSCYSFNSKKNFTRKQKRKYMRVKKNLTPFNARTIVSNNLLSVMTYQFGANFLNKKTPNETWLLRCFLEHASHVLCLAASLLKSKYLSFFVKPTTSLFFELSCFSTTASSLVASQILCSGFCVALFW